MTPRLGLQANIGQFALLVAVNALVGGMVGQERTVLPLLANEAFGLAAGIGLLGYLVAFGLAKAGANAAAGALADRFGRKPVLVAGWLIGLPVPLLLIWAPSWGWVIAANALLGVNQGLTWSTTVIMKIDLVGPFRRGLALGLNEAAGYGALSLTAVATGFIAEQAGLRPGPFLFGLAYAGLGLAASVALVRETHAHVAVEARGAPSAARWPTTFVQTSFRDRSASSACQAGLVNNLNDALAWGILPLYFATAGLGPAEIGLIAGAYPAVWSIGQIGAGAASDRVGRKPLIVTGMLLQGVAIAAFAVASGFGPWLAAAALLGLGTALVYPTLLAVVADVTPPSSRGAAIGVYRLWRDLGFVAGAIIAGAVVESAGIAAAIWVVAALTVASGLVTQVRMRETRPLGESSGA